MPTGIEIISSSGAFMLDANLANPTLMSSGTATTVTNSTTQRGTSEFSISFTPVSPTFSPICAIRPPTGAASWQISSTVSSGTYTWKFICVGAVGTSIPYWVFDKPTSIPNNFGIEVFDTTGTRIFHSGRFPLRVKAPLITSNVSIVLVGNTNSAENYTFTPGRTYAAFFGRPSGFRKYVSAGGGTFNLVGYNNGLEGITDGIRTVNILHSRVGPTSTPNYSLEREWLTRFTIPVDVTNY